MMWESVSGSPRRRPRTERESAGPAPNVLRRLKPYYWPYRRTLYLSVVTMGGLTAAGLVRPFLVALLIDRVITAGDYRLLWPLSLAVLAVAAVRGVLNYTRQYAGELFGQKVIHDLRNAIYGRLQYLPFAFYDRRATGDLMALLVGDVDALRGFLTEGITDLADFFFMVGFGLIAMLRISPRLTLVGMLLSPCVALTVWRFDRRIRPAYESIRRTYADLSTVVQEGLSGVRTVKAYAREPHELGRFAAQNDAFAADNVRAQDLQASHVPLMRLGANLGTALLLWYGGRQVIAGSVSLGDLVAFFSLIGYLVWPVQELGYLVNIAAQAVASGRRLLELLDEPRPTAATGTVAANPVQGHVRFEGVSFAYPDGREVLHDIHLDVPPGTVVGLLGATGAGKSTLVSLIPRFYEVTRGRITLDGVDLRNYDLYELRRQIGIVPGDTFLFSASIRDNIAFGRPDAALEEIEQASRLAAVHDFVAGLPDRYATVVGERGLGLSGGQKQRVALARALLCDPRLLILDDATSHVDLETETAIQRNLRQALRGRTAFVIAHRLASLRWADQIVVLEGGRIAERGRHEELLRLGGRYAATFRLQYPDTERQGIA